ncbi:helix-turn-helix domain-containing protein [Dactylosporangium sp. CS-047395]|uniref:helix-turn-helix domain-containing protein n=1 Tax=Dactylosporangium sp. CS-047395 TaxID=3239936 RepID=UPI003D8D92E7
MYDIAAIEVALRGLLADVPGDREILVVAVMPASAKETKAGWSTLSDRQREVARLVRRGLINRHIATRLGISTHTVNYHLRKIFNKLDLGSRAELAAFSPPE